MTTTKFCIFQMVEFGSLSILEKIILFYACPRFRFLPRPFVGPRNSTLAMRFVPVLSVCKRGRGFFTFSSIFFFFFFCFFFFFVYVHLFRFSVEHLTTVVNQNVEKEKSAPLVWFIQDDSKWKTAQRFVRAIQFAVVPLMKFKMKQTDVFGSTNLSTGWN